MNNVCFLVLNFFGSDKLENITELPDGIEKVDVIISFFMGYSLLYESMMTTVLIARDRWLAPGGIMMPDQCELYLYGVHDPESKDQLVLWWEDTHCRKYLPGVDLRAMLPMVRRRPWKYPLSTAKVRDEEAY
jgi:protein arginine N-methyltransferase 1